MATSLLKKIKTARKMYKDGRYKEALVFYAEALSMAKTKPEKIALNSKRAACFLKLHDFNRAAEECTSVLELDQNNTRALKLRVQTLVFLKEYRSALFDLNRLKELDPSSEVYENFEARLRTQLSLAPIPESEAELEEEEEIEEAELCRCGEEQKYGESVILDGTQQKAELEKATVAAEVIHSAVEDLKDSSEYGRDQKFQPRMSITAELIAQAQFIDQHTKGWQAIPKPKGHSTLDYAPWDKVEDDSSDYDYDGDDEESQRDDEESQPDDEESQPQDCFHVRTVGV